MELYKHKRLAETLEKNYMAENHDYRLKKETKWQNLSAEKGIRWKIEMEKYFKLKIKITDIHSFQNYR
jgi:hypothetical protein